MGATRTRKGVYAPLVAIPPACGSFEYCQRPSFHIDEPYFGDAVAGIEREFDFPVVTQGGICDLDDSKEHLVRARQGQGVEIVPRSDERQVRLGL